ncbi:hypothetical protein SMH99_25830 [Spiroplasma poulsonii]|nr:hypothetical protein [Spiroplasma poulsonii]PWF94164.1 hypothetical protein SMH99_25830 [Spiroplasma poulsonii]
MKMKIYKLLFITIISYFGTNEKLYKLRINDKEAIKVNNIIGDLNNLISF